MKKISIICLMTLLSFSALSMINCSGDGSGSISGTTEGFSFYLNFDVPMNTNFPERAQTTDLFPDFLTIPSAHATASTLGNIRLWNVSSDVLFLGMVWETTQRMLVRFETVPSSVPVVSGSINPEGRAGGFTTATGNLISRQDFSLANDGNVHTVNIEVSF